MFTVYINLYNYSGLLELLQRGVTKISVKAKVMGALAVIIALVAILIADIKKVKGLSSKSGIPADMSKGIKAKERLLALFDLSFLIADRLPLKLLRATLLSEWLDSLKCSYFSGWSLSLGSRIP